MNIIAKRISKVLIFLSLLFVMSNVFPEEHLTGKMLIMGWNFIPNDTALQTNLAVDALQRYVEAAYYQMISEEGYEGSCRIELYASVYRYDRLNEGVFIYIYSKSVDHYLNRFIEIDFYIMRNGYALKYKLVLNYHNYKWSEDIEEKNTWELALKDEPAYDFFVSYLETLRR
jgi:hypothetical protein